MSKIDTKVKKAIDIIIAASKSYNPSEYFGRKFDDLFENGNSDEIVNGIVKNYLNNSELQNAIIKPLDKYRWLAWEILQD